MNRIENEARFYEHQASHQNEDYYDYEIVSNFNYRLEIDDVQFPLCRYCGYDGGIWYDDIEVYNACYDYNSEYACRSCAIERDGFAVASISAQRSEQT